jgi:hypothetical protein
MEHREGSWEKQAESAVQVTGAARGGYRGPPLITNCRQILSANFKKIYSDNYFEKCANARLFTGKMLEMLMFGAVSL